jgi:hypothetical protein
MSAGYEWHPERRPSLVGYGGVFHHAVALLHCPTAALSFNRHRGTHPQGPRGFFVRKCPYCLGLIWSGASICSHCRRAVPKSATTASSLIGIEKVYLGYTYVAAENGEAELKLSSGEWRKFSSTQRLEEYVDGLEEYVDAGRQRDRAQD